MKHDMISTLMVAAMSVAGSAVNPFTDCALTVTFTHESGSPKYAE